MKKIVAILISTLLVAGLTSCQKANTNLPYKYIVMCATTTGPTKLRKIGMDDSIITTKKSKTSAIGLSSFMQDSQTRDGLVYQTAAVKDNGPVDFAVVQIDPVTLKTMEINGISRATSFLVTDDAIYSAACNNPSRIAKTVMDKNGKWIVEIEGELDGMISEIFEDGGNLYVATNEDPEINAEHITITQVDRDTLKAIDKFILPYNDAFGDMTVTEEAIYFSPMQTVYGVVRYDKKTKECLTIDLSFNVITSSEVIGDYLYVLSTGDFTGDIDPKAKIAKIDLATNKVVLEKNLSYFCIAHCVGSDRFVTMDSHNIYELDLETLEPMNTIKIAEDDELRYNAIVSYEQIAVK